MMSTGDEMKPNFIELDLEEANHIDLTVYSFITYSESKSKYIFKLRESKR